MSVICSANIIVEKIIVYICSFCVANQMCTVSISMKNHKGLYYVWA